MACLVAPAAVAVITTAVRKKVPAKYHIDWLLWMLWGGVAMLIVDHVLNGEIVPYFPFFTAGYRVVLKEILSVGVPMTIFIFCLWGMMVHFSILAEKRKIKFLKSTA